MLCLTEYITLSYQVLVCICCLCTPMKMETAVTSALLVPIYQKHSLTFHRSVILIWCAFEDFLSSVFEVSMGYDTASLDNQFPTF